MFLHLLTPDQQQTFFRAAGLLVHSDSVLAQAEIDLVEAAQVEANIDAVPSPASSTAELHEELRAMRGTPSARALLVELAGLAVVDGASSEERVMLTEIAASAGVGEEDLDRIVDVAARALSAQRDATALVAGG